ncbi:uncharacterized protein LOC130754851 [Actinidia eriantha]|uniref:uncharacterized protein LOC130754851 n=1 Tax=Actinidia eriantha TaxID=165200 RepID=UPI002582A71D|nr:uncharacterized protein LOC130754851 [Actinidia eriantha]
MDTSARTQMEKNLSGFEPSSPRQRGRRRESKSNYSAQMKKKKPPQRGMGVAQLERLRLQERWAKMAQNNSPLQSLSPYDHPFYPTNQALLLPRLANGQFCGPGFGGLVSDTVRLYPYWVGAPNPDETSRGLSSMPTMRFYPDPWGLCHKEKRVNGENLGYHGMRDANGDPSKVNGCDFLGFNLGNSRNTRGENGELGMRESSQTSFSCSNGDQEVEVVGVERKNLRVESVIMEYEFFPRQCGRGPSPNELDLETSVAVCVGDPLGGCLSLMTPTSSCFGASIDLSLKLSC